MKSRHVGFTTIELIVVIAVIGILTAIAVIGFTGVQMRSRDAERAADISAIRDALERYYTTHGEYPKQGSATTDSMSSQFPVISMNIPAAAVIAPGAPSGTINSIDESSFGAAASPNKYAYVAYTTVSGTDLCRTAGVSCQGYSLYYFSEARNQSIHQRNQSYRP